MQFLPARYLLSSSVVDGCLQKNIDFLKVHCQIKISFVEEFSLKTTESKGTYQALFSRHCAILKMSLLFNFMHLKKEKCHEKVRLRIANLN